MTKEEIISKIRQIEQAIENYEELDSDMDNPEYVARGNGFCDSKYSDDFLQMQIAQLTARAAQIKEQMNK